MNKWRRYVYFVVNNFNSRTYPLRRIDASSLFYPRNQMRVTPMPPEEHLLPRPVIGFTPSLSSYNMGLEFFGFFGRDKKSLLAAVDYRGVSLVYDVEDHRINKIDSPSEVKFSQPISLAVDDALYVMDRELVPDSRCFESLIFGPSKKARGRSEWAWHCLQPPPFVRQPGFKNTCIGSYTVVGGNNIWISTPGIGTYSFDTASGTWIKVGDWELPFHGCAHFISEYGVWLGFSAKDMQLCCLSNLGASMQHEPALDMVWGDANPERNTNLRSSYIVHLGKGKFCIAKLFERVENELTDVGYIPQIETFALFTGYVIKPSGAGMGLEVTPHKSLRCRFEGVTHAWVF